MFVIIGILIVFGAVIGGYLMEHGHLMVLFQPAELVIIGGAAFGTIFIANSVSTVKSMFGGILTAMKGDPFDKKLYAETLTMLNDLFSAARKNGATQLEAHIEDPVQSAIFSKYPKFLKHKGAVSYVCDTLRMSLMGGVNAFELDQMMELDSDIHLKEANEPVHALQSVADALPGLGIVAAVLGVVITMGSLGGPPEAIGHKVAAALVGTFLGILLCYGLVGPLSVRLGHINESEGHYFGCLRNGVIAYVRGAAPILAVEFARRSIPSHVRPSFKDVEGSGKGAEAEKAAA
jgi:chemotaxis protein MotA